MKILLTGGAGFIGSAVVRQLIRETDHEVVNVDKLTYAGNLDSLAEALDDPRHHFERVDICDADEVRRVFEEHRPDAVMHLAAESHVDRSIDGPGEFIRTNVVGTFTLLQAARAYWDGLEGRRPRPVPVPPRLDRRGLRLARPRGVLHRGDPLRPEVALLGEQGGLRPPGPGLAPHLRPADAGHQLLEQLRPVPFPREADPAGHPQRQGRQAPAGLRQGGQRPRLALRRRPRPGPPPGPGEGRARRDVQHRRPQRADQPRGRPRRSAGCSTR